MSEQKLSDYYGVTRTARLNKGLNMLRGLVAGLKCSQGVSDGEIMELSNWVSLHADLRDHQPFQTIIPLVEDALSDGVITEDERDSILWACDHATGFADYYDDITASIQYLTGLVHGLLADNDLTDAEIHALRDWLRANDFLSGTYPFDEIYSTIVSVLCDGIITEAEREQLMAVLSQLVDFESSYNLAAPDYEKLRAKYTVGGICALCPEIEFSGKSFVISGESDRANRSEFVAAIERLGGVVKSAVSKRTDYLIVGNAGNPCWAFSCYGRKIEQAMQLRKEGAKVVIVNENDFWDAVEDAGCN